MSKNKYQQMIQNKKLVSLKSFFHALVIIPKGEKK